MAGQAAGAGLQAQAQVVPHRQLGNDLPPLGHVADPRPGPLVGRQGQQIPPRQTNLAPLGSAQVRRHRHTSLQVKVALS